MNGFLSKSNGLQHHSQLRFLQETGRSAVSYYTYIYSICIGLLLLSAIIGVVYRIRARRRRVVRAAPQNLVMTGFQLSSSVSPQSYGQSYGQSAYYPNQEQVTYPYPNVNYPGYQQGVNPNANPHNVYGMQQGYNGGTYQQNQYSGYAQA